MIIDPIDLERSSLVFLFLWPIKIPTSISFPWVYILYNTSMVQLVVCFDEEREGEERGII